MSRRSIPARTAGFTVVVGWDNPLATFFAQVLRNSGTKGRRHPVVFWTGGEPGEVALPEDLSLPLAPYADLDAATIALLREDRAECADRGATPLQRTMLARLERRP